MLKVTVKTSGCRQLWCGILQGFLFLEFAVSFKPFHIVSSIDFSNQLKQIGGLVVTNTVVIIINQRESCLAAIGLVGTMFSTSSISGAA